MASSCRRKAKLLGWLCCGVFATVLVDGCGPPLTQPSSLNITGRWITSDSIGPISNLQVTISQRSDGTLGGQWSGKSFPPDAPCPPQLGATPSGPVSGSNTVLGVQFSLLGAGDFEGQAIDSKTLKGGFESCGSTYATLFSLAGPVPP